MAVIPDPIDWQTIEDALYDWFAEQSGVPVVWADQDSPQPQAYPFGTIAIISGPNIVGASGNDELRTSTDLGQPAGEEVLQEFGGQREMTVSCQVFTKPPESFNPSVHARAIMSRVQSSLAAPSVLEAFLAAGLAVVNQGDVDDLSEAVEDTWIGRSNLDVLFGLSACSSERTGYIKTVEISAPDPFDLVEKPFGDC